MSYLYGDSTPSPLTSNFLEFLRDAIDFGVVLLQADERIARGHERSAALGQEADAELERLDRFIEGVLAAIDAGEKGGSTSPTAHCAIRTKELVQGAHAQAIAGVRNDLAAARARIQAEESDAREHCVSALGALLGPHDPPDGTSRTHVVLAPNGYEGTREGAAAFGIAWACELTATADGPWSMPVRLERIAPHLEINAPQVIGWLTREVKVRPLRLGSYVVTELLVDGPRTEVKLRTELGSELGFDLKTGPTFEIVHVGPPEDAANGAFELTPAERSVLEGIVYQLRTHLAFDTRAVLRATTGETEFRALPQFRPFVEKLVAMLAPIVQEIAARSLTPNELVIRRLLGDDRREEIFVSKKTLRDKLERLNEEQRKIFAGLALDDERKGRRSEPPPMREPAASRAELPLSRVPTPPPIPKQAPPPPPPSPKANVPTLPTPIALSDSDLLEESVTGEIALLDTLEGDDMYRAYLALFQSSDFYARKPEEQRALLSKMVHPAKAPGASDAVKDAFSAAIARISTLAESRADPELYEMLGAAHLQQGDKKAAHTAFEIALKLERAKSPKSELAQSLEKRLKP